MAVSILGIQAAKIHKVNEKLTSHSFLAYIIYIPVIFMVCVICLLCFVDQQCPRDWGYLAKIWIIMINDCVCKKKLRALFWAGEILKEVISIILKLQWHLIPLAGWNFGPLQISSVQDDFTPHPTPHPQKCLIPSHEESIIPVVCSS